jgi:division protein CdvB (Snf7/Vps24/ESCRT-III family)
MENQTTTQQHLMNIVIQLTRIADELEKANKNKEDEQEILENFNYGGTA